MNKKLIRLTESDLHRIVKESVNKILSEIGDTSRGCKMLGRAYHKANKANDIVRGQKFGNYLRDKYGYTPHDFFDGIDDAEREEKGVNESTYDWDYNRSNEPPIQAPSIGSDDWFEDELNPNYSQVGQYDNMSSDFVNWANMNDKDNDYDETKSWDSHFKKIENDRSWSDFDREVARNKRAQDISKSPYFPNFGKLPKRNPNI